MKTSIAVVYFQAFFLKTWPFNESGLERCGILVDILRHKVLYHFLGDALGFLRLSTGSSRIISRKSSLRLWKKLFSHGIFCPAKKGHCSIPHVEYQSLKQD